MDINELSFDNIGSWPVAAHAVAVAVVFAGLVFLGYFFYLEDLYVQYEQEQAKESQLKSTLAASQRNVVDLKDFRKYLDDMAGNFEEALAQLPPKPDVADLVEQISRKGLENQLTIRDFSLGTISEKEFYNEMDVKMTMEGHYHQFGNFVNAVASLGRIVSLHDIRLTPMSGDSGKLIMTATAKIYWYEPNAENKK